MKPTGKNMYLLPVFLILGMSIYFVGGTNKLESVDTGAPSQEAIPKSANSSSSPFFQGTDVSTSSADVQAMQVGAFPFVTVTPTLVPGGTGVSGQTFNMTSIPVARKQEFDDEQQLLLSQGFTKTSDTIDSTPAIKLSGTATFATINGQRVAGPAQVSLFYVTRNNNITKFEYSYLGAQKDQQKEDLLTAMLSTAKLN